MSESSHDDLIKAKALTSLGLVTGRLGDPVSARRLGEQALAIKTRLGFSADLSASYHALGLAALDEDRNGDALKLFEKALETATSSRDIKGKAKALGGLGLAYASLGDLERARANHRAEREAARTAGAVRLEANALANEASVDIWEGESFPAIALLDTAQMLYRREHYAAGEQNALGQLATAYELTGREDLALAAFESSLIIAQRLGLIEQQSDLLRLIGGVHLRLGDHREALSTFLRAEKLMRTRGLSSNLGATLRGEADSYLRLGNIFQASASIQQALAAHAASSEPLDLLDDLLLGAEIDYKLAGPTRTAARLEKARTLAERINTRGARASVVLADAHIADLSKEPRRVLQILKAAKPGDVSGDLGHEWIANALKARAFGRLGQLDSARAAGQRAVSAVDRLRGTLASDALRSTYVADRAEVYGDLVITLLRMGRFEEAFDIADGARSKSLLDHLSDTPALQSPGQLAPEIAEEERLLRRIDALIQKLRETDGITSHERGSNAPTAEPLEIELADARSKYESLVARASQLKDRTSAILGAGNVRLSDVRATLKPGEALIEYMLTPDSIVAFVATRDALHVTTSAMRGADLVQRIRLVADIWGHHSATWRLGVAPSAELYRALVKPIVESGALRGTRDLVVVPHGILGELPFAALMNAETGRFLVQDFTVTSLPNAAALAALRRRRVLSQPGDIGGYGFAPFNRNDQLPATGPEVEAFKSSGPGRVAQRGPEATEMNVRRALSYRGIVHIASHGVINFGSPLFSRMELQPSKDGGSENDGRLEVHELLGLRIKSTLVFLSGCETGAGTGWLDDPVRGTGDLTLEQAMLSAGAENVIATLWPIADDGAARFATTFYGMLKTTSVRDAFSAAQREMIARPGYSNPYYWAGYVLAGEGRFSAKPQSSAVTSVPLTSGRHSTAPLTVGYKQ